MPLWTPLKSLEMWPMALVTASSHGPKKTFNHSLFTEVLRARQRLPHLGREDAAVQNLLDEAMTPRLKALSTTNYGPRSPIYTKTEWPLPQNSPKRRETWPTLGLSTALERWPVDAGSIQVINPRPSSGMTLLDFEIILPPSTWTSDRVLSIVDEANAPIPLEWSFQTSNTLYDSLRVQLVANVAAETVSTWRWSHREGTAETTTQPPTPTLSALRALLRAATAPKRKPHCQTATAPAKAFTAPQLKSGRSAHAAATAVQKESSSSGMVWMAPS